MKITGKVEEVSLGINWHSQDNTSNNIYYEEIVCEIVDEIHLAQGRFR
jgi:hypothetical protein